MKSPNVLAIAICSFLLFGAITACTQPNSSTPSDTTSSNSQPDSASKAERDQKREQRRKQIEAVLTPEQVKQLEEKLAQGEKMRKALASLDLTADQKAKIQEIYKAARQPKT